MTSRATARASTEATAADPAEVDVVDVHASPPRPRNTFAALLLAVVALGLASTIVIIALGGLARGF
jgi:hypothetical protein